MKEKLWSNLIYVLFPEVLDPRHATKTMGKIIMSFVYIAYFFLIGIWAFAILLLFLGLWQLWEWE